MADSQRACCAQAAAHRRAGWHGNLIATALLLAAASVQGGARALPLPDIQAPTEQAPPIQAATGRAPAVEMPRPVAPPSPAADEREQPASPRIDSQQQAPAPALLQARSAPARVINPAAEKELARLQRVAEPRSGFGSTVAAANAAWTLGLIELHGGMAQRSPAQAQTWFERATRFNRQPLAYAGLAWCHIEGCKGPPDAAAAQQAIAKLRPRYRARALYLEWMLVSRTAPLTVRPPGPEGVSDLRLPMRQLLVQAAEESDTQAHVELGIEAATLGDLAAARAHFAAAAAQSRAAEANLRLLDVQGKQATRQPPAEPPEAQALYERALRMHRGVGAPINYVEALRLYQAAAVKGSSAAKRMLAMITSRLQPDGTINVAWMAQLAYLDTASNLPQLSSRVLAPMMYRDPTPLFDLLPDDWQRRLTTVPR